MSPIQFTNICNRPVVPVIDSPQLIYILTELKPGATMISDRKPLNLTLLLDRSGSMAGSKLDYLKEAVKRIIDQLGENDTISIVTFETHTQVLVPSQLVKDKNAIKREIDSITDGGGTNLASGLREGIQQGQRNLGHDRTNRLVLLTDGEVTDKEEDSFHEADKAGGIGLPIIGLGFGKDWNDDFITEIVDRSLKAPGSQSGHVDYIQEPDDAIKIFQEVYDALKVIASDTTLNIHMVEDLDPLRVWQVTPVINEMGSQVIQSQAIVIGIGELDHNGASYLIEMALPPRPEGIVRIGQAELFYLLPEIGSQQEEADIIIEYSNDPVIYNQVDERVMGVVEQIQAFKLQTQALKEAELGQVEIAIQKLHQAVSLLVAQGESELAEQIQQEVNQLEKFGEISSKGKKTIKLSSRKTTRFF